MKSYPAFLMFLHDLAFWFCAFFLAGVFLISVFQNTGLVLIMAILTPLYFLIFKKSYFAILPILIFAGAAYYQLFGAIQGRVNIPFDSKQEITGVIKKLEQSGTKQGLTVELQPPYSGKVKINAQPYPGFKYGDLIKAEGVIKRPLPESASYFAKDGIFGTVNFPKITLVESGQGNFIKAALLKFKDGIQEIFKSVLPAEKAALLSGLTLGERAGFSKDLQNKMSLSGTTHIVALSGYNISVIAWAVIGIFSLYFSRSISFYLSILVIVLFVLMTGAEASVVRAATMGIIAILAKETERLFSMRNAIIIAAFLMVLVNPKVLVFDLGFQLSFAALLGIVYLMPVLERVFRIAEPGFLNWKKNSVTTLSAQLAVIPLLLGNFGTFSLTSFFSNILIAEAIPITMGLGFIMAGLGFISGFSAQAVGLAANFLLAYELWIIDFFSKFTFPVATQSFGFLAAIIYYLLLIGFIYKFSK